MGVGGDRELRPALGAQLRSLVRWFFRHQPEVVLGICTSLVIFPLILDFVPGTGPGLDSFKKRHDLGVSLIEHLLVAAFVAAAAYYYVLGLKRRQSLKNYRRACERPERLVEWSRATLQGIRRDACKSLADALIDSREPPVAVVKGRAGMSRTSFVIELVDYLAKRGQIPIPLVAPPDGTFRLESLAKQKFCEHVELGISSDEQADAIWHRARHTRGIVLLVDGVESELIAKLQANDGRAFATALEELKGNQIAVVIATTGELPLHGTGPLLREDLDRISHEGAVSYLASEFAAGQEAERAVAALDRFHDPADDAPVEPYYLDLIVRLRRAGIDLDELPIQGDRWRQALLARYLDAIQDGAIVPRPRPPTPDERVPARPGCDAKGAAEVVASQLHVGLRLAVARDRLKLTPGQLEDAGDLSLLRYGALTVGFASDDLGAYLVACKREAAALLADVEELGVSERPDPRHDRFALTALTFWHLLHDGDDGREAFSNFLTVLEEIETPRPRFVAAAVRIASACPHLREFDPRVADAASRCVDEFQAGDGSLAYSEDPSGPVKLVRALSNWGHPDAPTLLWRGATSRNVYAETPAAKALVAAKGDPGANLRREIERVLAAASTHQGDKEAGLRELSRHGSALGNEVAVLAWILPAFRPGSPESRDTIQRQYARLKDVCLSDGMIELRGEMSIAQGLKLALVNSASRERDAAERNAMEVKELLLDHRVRFWHARLVLVQAMLAYAWQRPERANDTARELVDLHGGEPHPLTRRGIELALQGLRAQARSSTSDRPINKSWYMWNHDGDVVAAVEQGSWKASRLAGDVVLTSNLIYRLWESDESTTRGQSDARVVAAREELPLCIRACSRRSNILPRGQEGGSCDCGWGLCTRRDPPAVSVRWGRFSEGFCREQARLVKDHGPPMWARKGPFRKRSAQLIAYWDRAAEVVSTNAKTRPNRHDLEENSRVDLIHAVTATTVETGRSNGRPERVDGRVGSPGLQ